MVSTWPEAIEFCTSTLWRALIVDAVKLYREQLASIAAERMLLWNDLENEIRPIVASLVLRKTEQVVVTNQLPKVVIERMRWDMLHFALETENADVCPVGFFAEQASWYLKGHFPCGRMGNKLTGRPIVY